MEMTCVSREVTRVVLPVVEAPGPGTNAMEETFGLRSGVSW